MDQRKVRSLKISRARGSSTRSRPLVIDLRRGVKMTDGRNETRERERERESVKAETPFLLASFHLLPGSTNVTREEVMSRLRYLTPRKSFHAHARNKFEGARLIRE